MMIMFDVGVVNYALQIGFQDLALGTHKEEIFKIFEYFLHSYIVNYCKCVQPFELLVDLFEWPSHVNRLFEVSDEVSSFIPRIC